MSALRDLPISRKFGFSFAAVCLLTAALGLATVFGFYKVNAATDDIVNNSMVALRALGDMRFYAATIRRTEGYAELCTTNDCVQHYTVKRQASIAAYNQGMNIYAPTISYPGEKELHETMVQSMTKYIGIGDQAMSLVSAGKKEDAAALLVAPDTQHTYDALAAAISSDVDLNNKMGIQDGNDSIKMGHTLLVWICILVAVTVALCAIIGVVLTRLVVPPLLASIAVLEKMASKDLTGEVESVGNDEIGRLSTAINVSIGSMRDVLLSLTRGAETLSAASEEMSQHAEEPATTRRRNPARRTRLRQRRRR